MSIFSSVELGDLRSLARSRMVDTFDVAVPTGGKTYDPTTQAEVEATDFLFTTPGYISPSAGILSQSSEAGGRTILSSRREVRIPWDSQPVPPGAVVTCTAIGPDTPPRMLGKQYRVAGSDGASQGTACHLEITEVLS